jgi:excisionase family DNA binding protein
MRRRKTARSRSLPTFSPSGQGQRPLVRHRGRQPLHLLGGFAHEPVEDNVRDTRIRPDIAFLSVMSYIVAPKDRASRWKETMATTAAKPQLLTVSEAAALLNVNERTVRRWIDAESIPYLELPGGSYRIPQGALLASLRGNYDLGAELRELDERNAELTDEQVKAALAGE